jgi:hypothetical protein
MKSIRKALDKIPALLSSTVSIFIFIFLFVYLFIFGLVGLSVQAVKPTADIQLIFGNYTNVLSALGAALAAGAGTRNAKNLRELHDKHAKLHASITDLHNKIDELSKK